MKLKLLAGAAFAAVCVASAASAQETGWYGAIDLGYHMPESIDTYSANGATDTSNGPTNNASTLSTYWDWTVDNDWAGFVRLGYQFTPHWRAEAEGGYRAGDLGVVRGIGTATRQQPYGLCRPNVGAVTSSAVCGEPDGTAEAWTLMGNVIYDFAPGATINPFVGVGIGVNRLAVKAVGQLSGVTPPISAGNPPIQNLTVDDADTNLAYQALAGVAWKVSDRLNLDLTYRYFGGVDSTFRANNALPNPAYNPVQFNGDYRDQSVTVGLRYSFAAPPQS